MASAESFFRPDEVAAIKEAVIAAELQTSGQVRVYIESHCGEDVLKRAAEVFNELELHKTAQSNGILFYLAVEDRKFAVLGDKGITDIVSNDFWHSIKHKMQEDFRAGKFAEGLIDGIMLSGEKLQTHFPHQNDGLNELSDDIVFG